MIIKNNSLTDLGIGYDLRLRAADKAMQDYLLDKKNRDSLEFERRESQEDKGWTIKRSMRKAATIPTEAFVLLPEDMRKDKKKIMKWIKANHPAFLLS